MSGTVTLTNCQYLQNLDQAYISLLSGQGVRSVTDQNGETVSFTMASAPNLLALIRNLAYSCPSYSPIALGGAGCGPGGNLYRRPLRVIF